MYRVYDNKAKKFIRENIFLAPNGDIYIYKKSFFRDKLTLVSEIRYIWQKDIGIMDKNRKLIFEGDIVKIAELDVVGVVAYAEQHASYYIFDDKNNAYYPFDVESVNERIEVIGNIMMDVIGE